MNFLLIKNRVYHPIIFIALLVLASCSNQQLPKLGESATILAFGDSLTAGVGVNREFSYPTVLANLTGLDVINAGVSGETTREGVARFKKLVEEHRPDLIILLEGGNDILRNFPEKETKANLASMISFAQQQAIPLVLIGVPKKSIFSSSADYYGELAESFGLVIDDQSIAKIIKNPPLKSDSVHFNRKGYETLANNIYQLLKSNGAVE